MREHRYMARFETYFEKRVDKLCYADEVRGIVLGDLFCQKRMFVNGFVDLILFIKKIMTTDKELVYQTPLYVTGRNIDEVTSVLKLLSTHNKPVYVIVQDFGVTEAIRRDFPMLKLIWGQMGRSRELRFSSDFLLFLKLKDFYGMETSNLELANRFAEFDLVPFFGNASLEYKTIGRNCYLQYQTGKCDRNACIDGVFELEADDSTLSMSIDGFMMGKKLNYIDKALFLRMTEWQNLVPICYF